MSGNSINWPRCFSCAARNYGGEPDEILKWNTRTFLNGCAPRGGGGGYETKHVLVSLWSFQIVKLNVRVRVMPLVALRTWIESQRVFKRTLSVTLLNRSMLLRLDSPSVTPGTDAVLYWRKADWTRYQVPPLPNLFRIGLELKRWNIRCLLLRYCTRHVFFKYILFCPMMALYISRNM